MDAELVPMLAHIAQVPVDAQTSDAAARTLHGDAHMAMAYVARARGGLHVAQNVSEHCGRAGALYESNGGAANNAARIAKAKALMGTI